MPGAFNKVQNACTFAFYSFRLSAFQTLLYLNISISFAKLLSFIFTGTYLFCLMASLKIRYYLLFALEIKNDTSTKSFNASKAKKNQGMSQERIQVGCVDFIFAHRYPYGSHDHQLYLFSLSLRILNLGHFRVVLFV